MESNYQAIPPITLRVNKSPTSLWDLSMDTLPDQPIEAWGLHTVFTAVATYTHAQGEFYLKDADTLKGILKKDTDDLSVLPADVVNPGEHFTYTVLSGETIWDIALKLGYNATELMENNSIDDHKTLQAGDVILLPKPRYVEVLPITYDIYPEVRQMHVTKEDGCRKFSFGNVKTIADLFYTGPIAKYEKNLDILGMAHVPIGDEDFKYYIDKTAYKDGKIIYTIGYNHTHLADGHVAQAVIPPPVFIAETIEQAFEFLGEPEVFALEVVEEPVEIKIEFDPDNNVNQFKSTISYFKDENGNPAPRHYCADFPADRDYIWMREYDGQRPLRQLLRDWEGLCDATFQVGDEIYCRPMFNTDLQLWFGIPERWLKLYSETYNSNITNIERIVIKGKLSEREILYAYVQEKTSTFIRSTLKIRR